MQLFKDLIQDNWIQSFSRVIDFYTGKIKGFKDVPEDEDIREAMLKADLKMIIIDIVSEQLSKWRVYRTSISVDKPIRAPLIMEKEPVVEEDFNPYFQMEETKVAEPKVIETKTKPEISNEEVPQLIDQTAEELE